MSKTAKWWESLPFYEVAKAYPAEGWWVTDFTKGQILSRFAGLEADKQALQEQLEAARAALREIRDLDFIELRAHGYSVGDKAIGIAHAALNAAG